ncbi:MAG: TolC family protein [Acidobacteria bacterium]|nr:TolC family protein [Acidobacteriota bacterium]
MISVLALLLSIAAAQQHSVLSEEEAVARALETNQDLAALRFAHRAATLTPKGIGLLANPQVRLGLTDVAAELNDPDRKRNNVGLAWSPPKWGELRLKSALAATRAEEIASEAAIAEQRLTAEVRVLYRNLAITEAQRELANETIRLRQRILTAVQEQVAAGVRGVLDRSNAELALADARLLHDQLNAERAIHRLRLAQKTGLASESLVITAQNDWYQFRPGTHDRQSLLHSAVTNRPELRGADVRCKAAELALSASRKELYPSFASVQVFRRTNREESPGSWGFQISLEVPIFRWKENGVAAATAQLEQCRIKRRSIEAALAAEIDELLARLNSASAELAGLRQTSLELSTNHVDLARTELAAGQVDKVEPLLAQLRVLSARQGFLAKLQELRVLDAGLRQATGQM